MARKGLNTAIAVVVTIVVLLIIAIAIVTMTTGTIGGLGEKASETTDQFNSGDLRCAALVNKNVCDNTPGCEWKESQQGGGGKCIYVGD